MPLADKLQVAYETYRKDKTTCKLAALTVDPSIPKKDRDALAEVIDLPENAEGFIPNSTLATILKEEGYDISASSVDRHRGNRCSCRRLVK